MSGKDFQGESVNPGRGKRCSGRAATTVWCVTGTGSCGHCLQPIRLQQWNPSTRTSRDCLSPSTNPWLSILRQMKNTFSGLT